MKKADQKLRIKSVYTEYRPSIFIVSENKTTEDPKVQKDETWNQNLEPQRSHQDFYVNQSQYKMLEIV